MLDSCDEFKDCMDKAFKKNKVSSKLNTVSSFKKLKKSKLKKLNKDITKKCKKYQNKCICVCYLMLYFIVFLPCVLRTEHNLLD